MRGYLEYKEKHISMFFREDIRSAGTRFRCRRYASYYGVMGHKYKFNGQRKIWRAGVVAAHLLEANSVASIRTNINNDLC